MVAGLYHNLEYYLTLHRGKVLILTYHRVLPENEREKRYVQPGMYVLPGVFEDHIRFLKEYYRILTFEELLGLWSVKDRYPGERFCLITFDDGWVDNYTYAFPILKKYGVLATIFLSTDFIGTHRRFWSDRMGDLLWRYLSASITTKEETPRSPILRRYPQVNGSRLDRIHEKIDSIIERCKEMSQEEIDEVIEKTVQDLDFDVPDERVFLDWKEIEEMSHHGIAFGSHSCSHRILTKLHPREVRGELETSLRTIQEKKINAVQVFCYPNGNHNPDIAKQVEAAGYRAGVSARFGFEESIPEDRFALKRIGIHQDISATVPLFTFHISGFNHLSWVKKRAVRWR
jgi:peptidoglycan/xylan/chitin deacetylase (PgdA/CDA1 family)